MVSQNWVALFSDLHLYILFVLLLKLLYRSDRLLPHKLISCSADAEQIAHHTGHVKSPQSASFAGIPAPAYAASSYESTPSAAGPNALRDVQQQLQEAAQALGLIVNALPQGPQALYQATESAAQSSQQSVQKALQQILQLQQQATAAMPAFQQQSQQPPTAASSGPSSDAPPRSGMMSSPAGASPAAEAASAESASSAASLERMPTPKQELEATSASQSLHDHEPASPQPVADPSGMPAPAHDPQRPTSVAEDEVHTVILRTNEADR